ncbi:hypothetical protein CFN78_13865 [Amycolatopsis antarctica]|uniref:DUF3592 domain-containing protein n=1 Tax=Amycolatopsis antarctica TaxID=1854586 RepID=A0A263D3P7_9PSEU|nr:hypothetical protein CFN78_13865 [Amycolatopsis antarctica]
MLLWVSLLVLVLSSLAIARASEYPSVGAVAPTQGLDGTASVTGCRDLGPFTGYGLGRAEVCTAEVSTPDGDLGPIEFRVGELTPADIGRTVAVRPDDGEWVRDVDHPYDEIVWSYIVFLIVLVLPVVFSSRKPLGYMLFSSMARFRVSSRQRGVAAHRVRQHRRRRNGPAPEGDGAVIVQVPPQRSNVGRYLAAGFVAALALGAAAMAGVGAYVLGGSPFELGVVHVPLAALLVLGLVAAALAPADHRAENEEAEAVPEIRLYETGIGFDLWSGERRTIPWGEVGRFSFVENRHVLGRGTVTAYVSFTDIRAAALWLTAFGNRKGGHGQIVSSSMTPEDVAVLTANVERARPGIVRWPRPQLQRGGFGPARTGRRAAMAVRRWDTAKHGKRDRRAVTIVKDQPAKPTVTAEGKPAKPPVAEPVIVGHSMMTIPRRIWILLLPPGLVAGPKVIASTDGVPGGVVNLLYAGLLLMTLVHFLSGLDKSIPQGDIVVAPRSLTWHPAADTFPVRVSFDHVRQVVVDAVPTGFAFWLGLAGRTSVRIVPAVDDFARRYPTLPERDGEFVLVETVSGGAAARLRRAVAEVRAEPSSDRDHAG